GAVDRQVHAHRSVWTAERFNLDAEVARRAPGGWRARQAADVEAPRGQGRQQICHRRAGPQADDHPALDEVGGCPGDDPLLSLDVTDRVHLAQAPPILCIAVSVAMSDPYIGWVFSRARAR